MDWLSTVAKITVTFSGIVYSTLYWLLNSARSILFILDPPNRYSWQCRKGITTCPDTFSRPQPGNSHSQAPAVHRFTSYRLLRTCKCIASYTTLRITSLPAGFGQCFFAASSTNIILISDPMAASSSCSLHKMLRQLLLNIQLSWYISRSPLMFL